MPIVKADGLFARFRNLEPGGEAAFGDELRLGGFSAVRVFLEEFRAFLKEYDEPQQEEAERLIGRARAALPEPGRISPAWAEIWDEFEAIVAFKKDVFNRISPDSRDGEWQVLLDNPYTNNPIAVYPGLSFLEATYLYAYFRSDLVPNEVIRMQRIQTVLSDSGRSPEPRGAERRNG
jgi:hypothetical protein